MDRDINCDLGEGVGAWTLGDDDDALLDLATSGRVTATDGSTVEVHVGSICVHGDSPNSVAMLRSIRKQLQDNAVEVKAPR